jgi:23S rRNA (cytidine1920-2'-O)/16S rRNA (cytidine1409-2'-O)-methyltransferase
VARRRRVRLRELVHLVQEVHPGLDAADAIADGRVAVDGRVVTNPRSLVRRHASIAIRPERHEALRGEAKLVAALRKFDVRVEGRVALDLGAAAGGFTRALLGAGATRVYAVDVGYGQLRGALRQDPAVVNLERTNVADLGPDLVPEPVSVVTADLSYGSLARAVPQLNDRIVFAPEPT